MPRMATTGFPAPGSPRPYTGALWTPGYWGWYGNRYRFHYGFWGQHIGFYGRHQLRLSGTTGVGYRGGYWQNNNFYYNRDVNRINVNVVRNVLCSQRYSRK